MVIDHGKHTRHGHGEHPGRGQFFRTATLGERGQIVIPKAARDLFELGAGDKLLVLGGLTAAVSAAVYVWVVDRWFVRRDETAMGAAFGAAYKDTAAPCAGGSDPTAHHCLPAPRLAYHHGAGSAVPPPRRAGGPIAQLVRAADS